MCIEKRAGSCDSFQNKGNTPFMPDSMPSLIVEQFSCLQDNYGFLIHAPHSGETVAIDTPDATRINDVLAKQGWTLSAIWNTHWHFDHTGGNLALKEKWQCSIWGPAHEKDKIPGLDHPLQEGDQIALGHTFANILATPGHTNGHIVFYIASQELAFVGDTLFSLGCGRLFEGTAEQMWASLQKLRALPPHTTAYCAHEYTKANGAFAQAIDPTNQALQQRMDTVCALRAKNAPSVPMTIGEERATNPFLRTDDPVLKKATNTVGLPDWQTFAALRSAKDCF